MALTDVIDSLMTDTLTVTRGTGPGTWSGGIFTRPGTTTFATTCVVEPATGQQRVVGGMDMHDMPSGNQVDDVRVLYTRDRLLPESEGLAPGTVADRVAFEGANWLVFRCEPWNLTGDIFFRVTITRITEGAS